MLRPVLPSTFLAPGLIWSSPRPARAGRSPSSLLSASSPASPSTPSSTLPSAPRRPPQTPQIGTPPRRRSMPSTTLTLSPSTRLVIAFPCPPCKNLSLSNKQTNKTKFDIQNKINQNSQLFQIPKENFLFQFE